MVCAMATRPNISGVLIAASIRAMLRPRRYLTESSSAAVAATLSIASASNSEMFGHRRDLLQTVGAAIDRAVLVVERVPQHAPSRR